MNFHNVGEDSRIEDTVARLSALLLHDPDWYRLTYPDVDLAGLSPALHFAKYGACMRRNPGPDFNTGLYAWRNRLPGTVNPLLHYDEVFGSDRAVRAPLPVSDLKHKLWGGFAAPARAGLEAALTDTRYDGKSRADAAMALARYHALNQDWDEAVRLLKSVQKFDKSRFRSRKTKILLIDCCSSAGQFDTARNVIDFELGKKMQGDFTCGLANLFAREGGPGADAARLAALNALYLAYGFAPIALEDPAKGLVFGNIRHDPALARTVEGPLVSVLMPVYKAGAFLDVAMNSMLNQTWANLEIVAVEDCSPAPDDSWDRLQAFAARDPRVKVFRNAQNQGAYPTRNRARHLAIGDFVTVHDSDDWSHPQMIEAQMRALLADPEARATCSAMTRVLPDLSFILRPQRENLEHVHRSYPSLLLRRADLDLLGEWDAVSANADDELVQRARLLWGAERILDADPEVPLSFFLVHENSLTQQPGTSLNSLTFGIRREYSRQAEYWRSKQPEGRRDLPVERRGLKDPFPIPAGLAPRHWPRDTYYDLVIVSDMSLLGGTRRCNEGYLRAARALGMRVGLFHWPRYDLRLAEVDEVYVAASYDAGIDILVPEDRIEAGLVLIHHPPILGQRIDAVPRIAAGRVAVLVNQLPMQCWSQPPFYYQGPGADRLCRELFGRRPDWIAISPRTREVLERTGGFGRILDEIWYPPLGHALPAELPAAPAGLGGGTAPVIGRHARSHWTKWPHRPEDLRAAYCAGEPGISVRMLGGAEGPQKMLGELPANWEVLDFDSVAVADFLHGIDFFLHYVHDDYIEEFGRNVMEAMAAGRVAILPPGFGDIFGDAAHYAPPSAVAMTVRRLWADPAAYRAQAEKGFAFVRANSAPAVVEARLKRLVPARPVTPVTPEAIPLSAAGA